jgi:hypothetical protein
MNSGCWYPFPAFLKLDSASYSPAYVVVLTGVVLSMPWSRVMVVMRTGVGGLVVRRWTSWSLQRTEAKHDGAGKEEGEGEGESEGRKEKEEGQDDSRMQPSVEVVREEGSKASS